MRVVSQLSRATPRSPPSRIPTAAPSRSPNRPAPEVLQRGSTYAPSAHKMDSAKFVVAISEPHHVAAAEHLENCQLWVSRCRTSPRTERGNVARCCDLLR